MNAPFSELDFFKSRLSKIEPLMSLKQKQINSLLEITEAVNNNWPIEALVRVYESTLIAHLGIQKIALLIKSDNQHWNCISSVGTESIFHNINFNDFVKPLLELTSVSPVNNYEMSEFEFVIPIAHKKVPIGFSLIGNFKDGDEDTKEEKLKFVQTITNIILVANENKRLFKNQMDKALLEKELKLAADMQNMLVPSRMMNNEYIETAAYYKPHKDIGGDYYDFIQLNDEEVLFCISDISGKGVPAALLMANFQANLHAIASRQYALDSMVDLLNKKVAQITKGEKFITFFVARYNIKTRQLLYVNAGHNPSVLYHRGGAQLLDKGCTILGMFDVLPFINVGEVSVPENSLLINYTDGVTEAANPAGDLYDIDGLLKFTEQNFDRNLSDFNHALINDINTYRGNEDFDDDLTLLSIRMN